MKKSVILGRNAEAEFDALAELLAYEREAFVVANFPEYRPGHKNRPGRFHSRGEADRTVFVPAHHDGVAYFLTAHVEIKSVQAKNVKTMSARFHQYERMRRRADRYGATGVFFVEWRWKGTSERPRVEYRLHNVDDVVAANGRYTLVRREGARLAKRSGIADWLTALYDLWRI